MIIEQLKTDPTSIHFSDVIEWIDEHYDFVPTSFGNGELMNDENVNNGSCKIFSFAKIHELSKDETLALFGDFYRKDVLGNPTADDHQNIRNFMRFGWDGIVFSGEALTKK